VLIDPTIVQPLIRRGPIHRSAWYARAHSATAGKGPRGNTAAKNFALLILVARHCPWRFNYIHYSSTQDSTSYNYMATLTVYPARTSNLFT
jgi:hypothetical protein